MEFSYNDGGNPKGVADCVARALAISLNKPYYDVAQALAGFTQQGGVNVGSLGFMAYMEAQGFKYVPAYKWLRRVADMPADCIVHIRNHYTAVVAGIVNDTIDTRNEAAAAYWVRGRLFNVVRFDGSAVNSAPMNFEQALDMRRLSALNYNARYEIHGI